jgi:polar amino acid transport system substrate-binding protein
MIDINHVKASKIARIFTVLALIAAVSVLAGCGSDEKSDSAGGASASTTATKDDAAVAKLPADFSGPITVATDASYPPNEFYDTDNKTIIGMDVDLSNAIAQTLGTTAKISNVGFDAILTGIQAEKYDLGVSSFTDNKEREEAVDFVTYLTAGTGFYTNADSPADVTGLESLCGKKVAVEKGTTQADDAAAQLKKCKADGKSMTVSVFADQNAANLAITSGRADVGMADSPVASYIVEQSGGKLERIDAKYDFGTAPYGIALAKDSTLTPAIQAAVQSLIDNGTYDAILKKWNLQGEGIDTAEINAATS